MTSVIGIGDFHCGSRSGLTADPRNKVQEILFGEYKKNISLWENPDIVIANGDLIDGLGFHDPSQTQTDLLKQAKDAFNLLKLWDAKKYFLTFGTPFHVTSKVTGVDYEQMICDLLNEWRPGCARIEDDYNVNPSLTIKGVRFNVRHKVGTSIVPYGKATLLLRNVIAALMKKAINGQELPHVILRSHAHYYLKVEEYGIMAVIIPCWQHPGSKFGNRQCEGLVDVGSVRFKINEETKEFWMEKHIINSSFSMVGEDIVI